ncbi:MAG: DUF4235 domain-containing protein [Rothia sp. (in: high G+C Gram-positive bacteria)]|nr:DUF4235 domain-containing protein [Rothia sp. (in: high G+C Gram-positive bacteria)]
MNPIQLAGTAASLAGVALSNKVLTASWKKITGNEPPASNPDLEERWRDIILWSLLSGLVATVIKVSISRQAQAIQLKQAKKHGGQEEI